MTVSLSRSVGICPAGEGIDIQNYRPCLGQFPSPPVDVTVSALEKKILSIQEVPVTLAHESVGTQHRTTQSRSGAHINWKLHANSNCNRPPLLGSTDLSTNSCHPHHHRLLSCFLLLLPTTTTVLIEYRGIL